MNSSSAVLPLLAAALAAAIVGASIVTVAPTFGSLFWGLPALDVLLCAEPDPSNILKQSLQGSLAQQLTLHASTGELLKAQGRYAEAVFHAEELLRLTEGSDTETAQRAAALLALGQLRLQQGRLQQARQHIEAALAVSRIYPSEESLEFRVRAELALATVEREFGRLDEALRHLEAAESLVASSPWLARQGLDTDLLVEAASGAAEVYAGQGQYDLAVKSLEKALSLQSALQHKLGLPSADDATSGGLVASLGAVRHIRGDARGAQALYRQALRAQRRLLRTDHPDLVATHMAMVRARRDLGEITEALEELRDVEQALRAGKQEGPVLGRVLRLRADLLRELGELQEAERLVVEALDLLEASFGGEDNPEHAVVLNSYGLILHDWGKLRAAHNQYERALQVNLQTVGPNHLETAVSHNSLGTLFEDIGQDDQALMHFAKCLEIQLGTVGERSPDVGNTYNNLGTLLFRQGSQEQAALLFGKAVKVMGEAGVPAGNPDLKVYEENLEMAQQALRKAEAEESAMQAEEPPLASMAFF